jgi:hypothetical protein
MMTIRAYAKTLVCLAALFPALLCARGKGIGAEQEIPGEERIEYWYTGPLLCPSGHTVPKGYGNIQPYLLYFVTKSFYNEHGHKESIPTKTNLNPFALLQFGVTNWMDISLIGQAYYQTKEGEKAFRNDDTSITFGFQLLEQKMDSWMPNLRLRIVEVFPTGKYQRLNPGKLGMDISSDGSFKTDLGGVFQKLFTFENTALRLRWFFNYRYRNPVKVHDLNAFGGGKGTRGTITFDPYFITIFSWEFSFSQRWVFANDIQYFVAGSAHFQGDTGFDKDGKRFEVGEPRSTQLSFAPALEYNFSENLGVIAGVWFTAYGTNVGSFISYVLSLDYMFPISPGK